MKQLFQFQSLFIGLLLAGLWGCSEEKITSVIDDSERQNNRLTVSVTDGGYIASSGEKPLTRAWDEGYTKHFTTGDKIGLYAVKQNGIITGYNNVCLTLAANGTWTPATDIFYEGSDAAYYVYYPYQESPVGTPVATASNAEGFFANIVSQWAPATDQGIYAQYTASDLMTGKGTMSGTPGSTHTLSFTLTHRMALVVMDLPKAEYALSTDASYTWLDDALDTKFSGFVPYHLDAGAYRYLVNPSKNTLLSGSYTNDASSSTKQWEFTPSIATGKYKTFRVDNGAVVNKVSHTLATGDFFMKNGMIVPVGKETLTEKEQADCIGIVFAPWVGNSDNVSNYDGKLTAIHGYVVSLRHTWTSWGDASKRWTAQTVFQYHGYIHTKLVSVGIAEGKSFPAFQWCLNYTPAPTGATSGWHFPALGQLMGFMDGSRGTINTSLSKVIGSTQINGDYISSSEATQDGKCRLRKLNSESMYQVLKSSARNVRAILTF